MEENEPQRQETGSINKQKKFMAGLNVVARR
jgi:hypothetical protein